MEVSEWERSSNRWKVGGLKGLREEIEEQEGTSINLTQHLMP